MSLLMSLNLLFSIALNLRSFSYWRFSCSAEAKSLLYLSCGLMKWDDLGSALVTYWTWSSWFLFDLMLRLLDLWWFIISCVAPLGRRKPGFSSVGTIVTGDATSYTLWILYINLFLEPLSENYYRAYLASWSSKLFTPAAGGPES